MNVDELLALVAGKKPDGLPTGQVLSEIVGNWLGVADPKRTPEVRGYHWKEAPGTGGYVNQENPGTINLRQEKLDLLTKPKARDFKYEPSNKNQSLKHPARPYLGWEGDDYRGEDLDRAVGTLANELTHFFQPQAAEQPVEKWNANTGGWAGVNQLLDTGPAEALKESNKYKAGYQIRDLLKVPQDVDYTEAYERQAENQLQSSKVALWAHALSQMLRSEANQPKGTRPR